MIPRASGLQIECGLFLGLTSDVGKPLQVMDVPCMCCGKAIHKKWLISPWETMELMAKLARVREDKGGLQGCAHHVKGKLFLQQLSRGRRIEGDRRRASPWSLR